MIVWLINVILVVSFLKQPLHLIEQLATARADLSASTIVNAALDAAAEIIARCQAMNYDTWTDEELRMLWHIQGLNRMQLDEYLGGLENG